MFGIYVHSQMAGKAKSLWFTRKKTSYTTNTENFSSMRK